ncbi:uncharacterized protein LOC126662298 [Mercurialis annua]|uniref:uncharacterized protein LOC126662298 n=1 Tax=Mercurialis annua TaxID=3986 RepID=UPI002160B49C|nr:uncharacterized protein LOC126662298 [Mercurialis annua]
MVVSWLNRSVSATITQSLSGIDNAIDIWNDLRERYSQGDATRIGDLYEEIYALKQNNLSVSEYFTALKIIWDELTGLRPIPSCICLTRCACGVSNRIKSYHQDDHVIKFLKGLNENFAQIRSHISMTEPLPAINKVFSLVLEFERQLGLSQTGVTDSKVFFTKGMSNSESNDA